MGKKSSAMPHLSLVSTTTSADSDKGEWVACEACGDDYRPHVIVDGLCDRCRSYNRKEQERAALQRNRIVKALGGERALEFTADAFTITPENAEAFSIASEFDPHTDNLFLFGGCGVGKTHLACMIARRALDAGIDALYVQPGRFLRRIRGKSGDEEQVEIDRLARMPVLVIDDLGIEKDTEYATQILYEVINDRNMAYRNGLIVTSNLSIRDLAKKFGEDRLPSRLAGMCRIQKISGEDWRLRKSATANKLRTTK
jgi:DNA replication protein DnaC